MKTHAHGVRVRMPGRISRSLACSIGVAAAILITGGFVLFKRQSERPPLQLPKGMTLAEALRDADSSEPQGWYSIKPPPGQPAPVRSGPKRLYYSMLSYFLGPGLPTPNPPREIDLISQLESFSKRSGVTYLVAREFMPEGWKIRGDSDYWLCFVYGGTRNARTYKRWMALHEAGIVNGGVHLWRKRQRPEGVPFSGYVHEPYLTNACAIVRDEEGTVKIVPIRMLRAYRDAGLLDLPPR